MPFLFIFFKFLRTSDLVKCLDTLPACDVFTEASTKMLRCSPGEPLNHSAPVGGQLKLPFSQPGSSLFLLLPLCPFKYDFSLCLSPSPLYTILKVVIFVFFWSYFEQVISWNVRTILPALDVVYSHWNRLRSGYAVHMANYSTVELRLQSRCCYHSLNLLSLSSVDFNLSLRVPLLNLFFTFTSVHPLNKW